MTSFERERYSRQLLFQGIGEEGQERLSKSTVVIVGCGALGAFQAGALARAGVGRLRLIDRDYVEMSNLQRQWLFEEADAREGLPKAVAAARRLAGVNSSITVEPEVADLTPDNVEDLLGAADVILDGTDNFETRYLINDYAVERLDALDLRRRRGQLRIVLPVIPGRTACFECVYPEAPSGAQPTCETAGVVNTVTAMVASWQVSYALRILCGQQEAVDAKLTTLDVWSGIVRQISAPERDPECPACARHSCRHLSGEGRPPISLCGRNAVQIHDRKRPLDLKELAARLAPLGEVRANDFALRFLPLPYEMTIFPDGRAIIKGTTDPGVARSLYARYIGS